MSTLTAREREQIDRANSSGRRPVVFLHGLWLLAGSWDRWRVYYEEQGYVTLALAWPGEPASVAEAARDGERFGRTSIDDVAEHSLEVVRELLEPPAVVGHSIGGLIAQRVAGEGASSVTVAIASVPFRGVTYLPLSTVRGAASVMADAVAGRATVMSFERFASDWAGAVPQSEARSLFDAFVVPAPASPLLQAATANVNPFSGARVDTRNHARGPLLLLAGSDDVIAPPTAQKAIFDVQAENASLTELVEMPGRGHSLTIDHGWRDVADVALGFIRERAGAQA
jgi:non-heme chloroperoxidase